MKAAQPLKNQTYRVLKTDSNYPSTPNTHKTYGMPSPASGMNKHQKPKHHQIFLSPSNLAPFQSPKTAQPSQRNLQTMQIPCYHATIVPHPKRGKENNPMSPNITKKDGLMFIPPSSTIKRKASPIPAKILDLQKNVGPAKGKTEFSISSTKVAAKLRPDRCSTESLKFKEITSKRQVMTLGDVEKNEKHEKPLLTEINLTVQTSEFLLTKRDGISQIGKGIEMNLSPINVRKEDLSSFLSDKDKLVCAKHPRKKAKYRVVKDATQKVENFEDLYCSECAIDFAMKGMQIEKIPQLISNTRTNTECDDKPELEIQCLVDEKEASAAIDEFRSKIGEAMNEIDMFESKYLNSKETLEKKVEMTRDTIRSCSESVIELFREETEKAIQNLNHEMNDKVQKIDLCLNGFKNHYQGYIRIKQEFEDAFRNGVNKGDRASILESMDESYKRIHNIKAEINKMAKPSYDVEKTDFESKINEYKKGLKTVLKEVISELEKDEPVSEKKQQTKDASYDDNMMQNLGAFEDFLRADESQDALQIRVPVKKGKPGDNVVVSFGSKEVFDNVLQTTEAMTLCSTQGNTMVLPSIEDVNNAFRPRENRTCTTETLIYENPRKNGVKTEEYEKFMDFIESKLLDQGEKERDGSFQKSLFHSPEFKKMEENQAFPGYFNF